MLIRAKGAVHQKALKRTPGLSLLEEHANAELGLFLFVNALGDLSAVRSCNRGLCGGKGVANIIRKTSLCALNAKCFGDIFGKNFVCNGTFLDILQKICYTNSRIHRGDERALLCNSRAAKSGCRGFYFFAFDRTELIQINFRTRHILLSFVQYGWKPTVIGSHLSPTLAQKLVGKIPKSRIIADFSRFFSFLVDQRGI